MNHYLRSITLGSVNHYLHYHCYQTLTFNLFLSFIFSSFLVGSAAEVGDEKLVKVITGEIITCVSFAIEHSLTFSFTFYSF
jgi:hypothetical protein